MMWDGMMSGWGWLAMLLWAVFGLAFLALMVLAVVWLVRNLGADHARPGAGPAGGTGSAREALDLRYARGEIGREEYLQARRDLEGPGD